MSTGYYMMVTGSRMANGGVLSQVSFFSVDKGKTTVTPLCMRNKYEEVRVIAASIPKHSTPVRAPMNKYLSSTLPEEDITLSAYWA